MKRIALLAAVAALAAPAAFAQTPALLTANDVIDHGGVVVSPPIQHGLPLAVLAPVGTTMAMQHSSTAVMGAGPGAVVEGQVVVPGTAILDVPRHAVRNPDFQKWLRWERSRIVGPM